MFLCSFIAKSRDVSHTKLDSEVVPKVARMTVSGKKQTMGFDVPRYLTQMHVVLIKRHNTFKLWWNSSLYLCWKIICCSEELCFIVIKLARIPSSAQGRTASSPLQCAGVAAPKTPPQPLPQRPRPNAPRLHPKGQMETSPPRFPPRAGPLERPGRRSISRLNWRRGRVANLC